MLLGAVTIAGALAAVSFESVPSANASCASFFGIGNSPNCSSNFTSIAVALGPNAQAHAQGLFGSAFAAGAGAYAQVGNAFTFATAVGDNTQAYAFGLFGIAAELGTDTGGGVLPPGGNGAFNLALNVSLGNTVPGGSQVVARGSGTVAINLFGNGTKLDSQQVVTDGKFNTAINLGGRDTIVWAGPLNGSLSAAFNVLGSNNTVQTGPGPLAIAGLILQNNSTATKTGPGFDVNGARAGGAAAVGNAVRITSAAVATRSYVSKQAAEHPKAVKGTGHGKRK